MFCANCGRPVIETNAFCGYCGSPIKTPTPASFSAPPLPLAPSATPNPAPVPPGPLGAPVSSAPGPALVATTGKSPWHRVGLILAVVAVVMLGAGFYLLALTPSPEDDLAQVAVAYNRGDAAAFAEYVDTQSVLRDFTDQACKRFIITHHPSNTAAVLAEGLAETIKVVAVPALAPSVERALIARDTHYVSTAETESATNDSGFDSYFTGFISRGIKTLIVGNVTFQSVGKAESCGADFQCVPVAIATSLNPQPVTLIVKMQRVASGKHWRIEAIQGIDEVVTHLYQVSN